VRRLSLHVLGMLISLFDFRPRDVRNVSSDGCDVQNKKYHTYFLSSCNPRRESKKKTHYTILFAGFHREWFFVVSYGSAQSLSFVCESCCKNVNVCIPQQILFLRKLASF